MNGQIKLLLPATDISVVLEALIFSELNCNNVVRLVSGKYHNTHKKKNDYTACAGHDHTEYTVHKIIVFK